MAKQRTFSQCTDDDVENLSQRAHSRNTLKGIAVAKNIWLQFLHSKNLTETPTDCQQLNHLLCQFWPSLRKLSNEEYSANTLFTMRQNLRSYIRDTTKIDILTQTELQKQWFVFDNYMRTLKAQGKGTIHHFQDVSVEDMQKVIATLTPDDPHELQWLCWFYLQLFLARRGIENTHSMKKSDIVFEMRDGEETCQRRITKNTTKTLKVEDVSARFLATRNVL